jgi:hypothetical protein
VNVKASNRRVRIVVSYFKSHRRRTARQLAAYSLLRLFATYASQTWTCTRAWLCHRVRTFHSAPRHSAGTPNRRILQPSVLSSRSLSQRRWSAGFLERLLRSYIYCMRRKWGCRGLGPSAFQAEIPFQLVFNDVELDGDIHIGARSNMSQTCLLKNLARCHIFRISHPDDLLETL